MNRVLPKDHGERLWSKERGVSYDVEKRSCLRTYFPSECGVKNVES